MRLKFIVTVLLAITLNSQNLSGQNIGNATILRTSIDSLIDTKMEESGIVGIGASIIIKGHGNGYIVL